jgi:photosystem II stability/assembly factor-like uncharacterized protein
MRRTLMTVSAVVVLLLPVAAAASTYSAGTPVQANVSTSPLGLCAPLGPGTSYPDTEVEPWLAVNPTNANNVVGTWQQDRYSGGASKGSSVGVSFDGGATFTQVVIPKITTCSGGTFERASDPWLSFSPNGALYAMSLVETKLPNGLNNPSGMAVNRSTDGGLTWSNPALVINDTDPTKFNDKNSLTADPYDANFVYAIWDRLDSPIGKGSLKSGENATGYRGPTWFARTTDGGTSWEPARQIFDPGNNDQTIGNQIVVSPSGTLIDVFDLIHNDNKGHMKGTNVAILRSTDRGATWSGPTIVSSLGFVQVTDPDTGALVRTGDIIPEVAVDPASGAIYVVWQDGRFSGGTRSDIAFSMSTDEGSSWSVPVRINTPANVSAFTPSIAVASDGTVGVSYYDFRSNTAAGGLPTDVWFAHCHAGCTNPASWAEGHAYGSFDMEKAPVARGYFLGDYEGIAAEGTAFNLLFSVAGSASNSADVVFLRMTA